MHFFFSQDWLYSIGQYVYDCLFKCSYVSGGDDYWEVVFVQVVGCVVHFTGIRLSFLGLLWVPCCPLLIGWGLVSSFQRILVSENLNWIYTKFHLSFVYFDLKHIIFICQFWGPLLNTYKFHFTSFVLLLNTCPFHLPLLSTFPEYIKIPFKFCVLLPNNINFTCQSWGPSLNTYKSCLTSSVYFYLAHINFICQF